jgi:Plasmid pRiA4b ORF-3-like protein
VARVIPPSPAVVSAELAVAALESTALQHARKLAEWIGPGRALTSSGVPRPAEAVEACRLLGIELPGPRLRSALDVDELMLAWETALQAGFVVLDGRRAVMASAPALDLEAARADPRAVLDAWLAAVAADLGVPDEPCAGCLTVLHELRAAERPLGLDELAEAVAANRGEPPAGELCPDCGGVHVPGELFPGADVVAGFLGPDEEDDLEHAGGAAWNLIAFGAAAVVGEGVELTPLGSMLATSVFDGCAPAPDADAKTLLAVISELPPPVAVLMAGPWLGARTRDEAVRELLACAEPATGAERVAALALAQTLGPEPVGAWREWAKRPGFGAYARQWLAEHGKPVAVHPEDEAWLIVDAFSSLLAGLGDLPPPLPLMLAFQQLGDDTREVLGVLRASGHPAADEVVAALGGAALGQAGLAAGADRRAAGAAGTTAGAGTVYQLRITLRYVDGPPVWRQVLVPGDFTLGQLHDVIQLAMGWEFSHMHSFETKSARYGRPDPELEFADESAALVAQVLPRKRSKLLYTYDFGDGWEHDVVVEERRPVTAADTVPCCLAGEGACPPEDCGGIWGYENLKEALADKNHDEHDDMMEWLGLDEPGQFDPAAFSVDEANARLGVQV